MQILTVARGTLAEWRAEGPSIAHKIDRVELTDVEPAQVHPVESPFAGSAWAWDSPPPGMEAFYRTREEAMAAMSVAAIAAAKRGRARP